MSSPIISVVMPVPNGETFLGEAIESILNQTHHEFELIIISENGTSEASLKVINGYRDPRIRHIQNETRLGLAVSLNRAIADADGEFIARMDSDDVSLPSRLERQLRYMDEHPHIGVLGSNFETIDSEGRTVSFSSFPTSPISLRWELQMGCPILHPSVLMRKSVFARSGGYDPKYRYNEDLDLWLCALYITELANLPDRLVKWREHQGKISNRFNEPQTEAGLFLARSTISKIIGKEVPIRSVWGLKHPFDIRTISMARSSSGLLLELHDKFQTHFSLCDHDMLTIEEAAVKLESQMILYLMAHHPYHSVGLCKYMLLLNPSFQPHIAIGSMRSSAYFLLQTPYRDNAAIECPY